MSWRLGNNIRSVENTKRCAALENLSDDEDTNRALENSKENNKTSAKESRSARIEAA